MTAAHRGTATTLRPRCRATILCRGPGQGASTSVNTHEFASKSLRSRPEERLRRCLLLFGGAAFRSGIQRLVDSALLGWSKGRDINDVEHRSISRPPFNTSLHEDLVHSMPGWLLYPFSSRLV